jgi:hydroxymethylglutaryl-CoA lyase
MIDGALASRVELREEGPRDGWQNIEDVVVPTERKLQFICGLIAAGVRRITITSLVHPRWVPQLADAEELLRGLERAPGVEYGVLVPNARGFERARALREEGAPIDAVSMVLSASEAHNRANVNMSIGESLAALEVIFATAAREGLYVVGGLATAFGCCFEGRVSEDRVCGLACALRDLGAQEVVFGDTTGMANPLQVTRLARRLRRELAGTRVTLHFHNTRGTGLANVLAALQAGVNSFEAAFGELGGCQFARGATGNVATEDVVCMLSEMGIDTGIDLRALLAVSREFERFLGRRLDGHVMHAGPIEWEPQTALEAG